MPAVSRAQQRALAAKFGWDWVVAHHFDKIDPSARKKSLDKRRKRKKRGR